MEIDEFISERIRMFRISNRYSQEDIGKYLNLPKQSISRIENNQRKVSSNELAKLAKFFKISVNDFFNNSIYETTQQDRLGVNVPEFVSEFLDEFNNYAVPPVEYKELRHVVKEIKRVLNGISEEYLDNLDNENSDNE